MCVPSVSVHTYVSFPTNYEDDCANLNMQEGEYITKIYCRETREISMKFIHHASLWYVENLTYYRDGFSEKSLSQ